MVCYEWMSVIYMTILLIVTYMLNIIDLLFTNYWVKIYGIGAELNPIGVWLYNTGIAQFTKTIFVGVLLLFVWYKAEIKNNDFAINGLYIIYAVYGVVDLLHCLLWLYIKTI